MNSVSESRIPELVPDDVRIKVGRFTYGSPRLRVWAEQDRICIGSFCSIADGVTIFGGGEHNTHWITTFPLRIALGDELAEKDGHPATKGITWIGNDVWIGDGATILSGVRVGNGAVIGAGAVVAGDIPAYHVAAGNPARAIRCRFTQDQVEALERIAWWNWPLDRIRDQLGRLCSGDVAAFIAANDADPDGADGVAPLPNSEPGSKETT